MKTRELVKAIADNDNICKKDKITAISFICSDEAKGPWKNGRMMKWGWKNISASESAIAAFPAASESAIAAFPAINNAFPWEETPQGKEFWSSILNSFNW